MRALVPYLSLHRCYAGRLIFGVLLAISTLLTNIALLILSAWFLAKSATVKEVTLNGFNYILLTISMCTITIIRIVSRWAERVISHDATFRVLQNLRLYILKSIFPLYPNSIHSLYRGELLNRLIVDVNTLDYLYLRLILPLTGAFIVTVTISIGLYLVEPIGSILLGTIMIAILVLFPMLFYRAGKTTGENMVALRSNYRSQLTIWLSCNAEIILYGANETYKNRLKTIERDWQTQQKRQSELNGIAQSLLLLVSGLTLTWLLWITAGNLNYHENFATLVTLFTFTTLAVFATFNPVAGTFQYFGEVISCAIRLNDILELKPKVIFPTTGPIPMKKVTLTINKLRFYYPQQKKNAIKDITLTIAAGEHVAILGHIGSGKSTLIKLLTRAWDPYDGEILLNGIPLYNWSEEALRTMTSVVEQRIHIFSATLRDNLRLASPNADDDQLNTVIHQVGLEKLLIGEGLNSWLGEGGRSLSGGEQRRIGIARALLHNSPLWLLDEPTEHLDLITEQQILHLLRTLGRERTIVMVTHRLYGLENFDHIYVLDCGTVIEQGNHQTLMALQGRYYRYKYPNAAY